MSQRKIGFFTYIGGKYYLLKHILPLIPKHKYYIEPFGGSGKVLLNKEPAFIEVFNDIDWRISNLFYVVTFHFEEFYNKVSNLIYSRVLYSEFYKDLKTIISQPTTELKLGDIDRAVKAYFVLANSFSGKAKTNSIAFAYQQNRTLTFFRRMSELPAIHERLKNVFIECQDFEVIIKRFLDKDEAFFYFDPPYIIENNYYTNNFTLDQHKNLLNLVKQIKGKWLLSGYANKLYEVELKDYYRLDIPNITKHSFGMNKSNKTKNQTRPKVTETLWANYPLDLSGLL